MKRLELKSTVSHLLDTSFLQKGSYLSYYTRDQFEFPFIGLIYVYNVCGTISIFQELKSGFSFKNVSFEKVKLIGRACLDAISN